MICECGHPLHWHGESNYTNPAAVCYGSHGSVGTTYLKWTGTAAVPSTLRGCNCRGYKPAQLDARGNPTPRVTIAPSPSGGTPK